VTENAGSGFWRSRTGVVCAGFLAIAAFFLLTEHTAPVLSALLGLLLAACPLMHLFMHHGGSAHQHLLATAGVYAQVRHPQYVGFIAIMFGFLLQRPTILTVVMFPLLVWMYARLARAEEVEALRAFGSQYEHYAAVTPRWIPHWRGDGDATAHTGN